MSNIVILTIVIIIITIIITHRTNPLNQVDQGGLRDAPTSQRDVASRLGNCSGSASWPAWKIDRTLFLKSFWTKVISFIFKIAPWDLFVELSVSQNFICRKTVRGLHVDCPEKVRILNKDLDEKWKLVLSLKMCRRSVCCVSQNFIAVIMFKVCIRTLLRIVFKKIAEVTRKRWRILAYKDCLQWWP